MLRFKPLEESLAELEKCAKKGESLDFYHETATFYSRLSVLAKYSVLGIETVDMVKHYQQRYDQIKLMKREK